MEYGLISLFGAQLAAFIAGIFTYVRQRNRSDAFGRESAKLEAQMEVLKLATAEAKATAERVEQSHYHVLRSSLEECLTENSRLKGKFLGLDESVERLYAKLASRDKTEKKAARAAAAAEPAADEDDQVTPEIPGRISKEDLTRMGAIPLPSNAVPARPSTFGKVARKA